MARFEEDTMSAALLVGIPSYFFPTLLACLRRHPSVLGIFFLNLLLGWTVVGWIVVVVCAALSYREHDRGSLEQGSAGSSGHLTDRLTLRQCRIVAAPFTGWTTRGDFQYYFAKGKLVAALRGDLYYPYSRQAASKRRAQPVVPYWHPASALYQAQNQRHRAAHRAHRPRR
jgi:hypothetical protein